jgi:hypothetical protein
MISMPRRLLLAACLVAAAAALGARAQTAQVSTQQEFKSALLDQGVTEMAVTQDIALTPDAWPKRTIPEIISRNLTIVGRPLRDGGRPTLDFGLIVSRVQVQQHFVLSFQRLRIVNAEDGTPMSFLRSSPAATIVWQVGRGWRRGGLAASDDSPPLGRRLAPCMLHT